MILTLISLITFLRIDAKPYPYEFVPGENGRVNIYIAVKNPDVRLYSLPPFKIYIKEKDSLNFSKDFYTAFDLKAIKEKENQKSKPMKALPPLTIPFVVDENAAPGLHQVNCEIEYLVCSRNREWCMKTRQPFSFSFKVKSYVKRRKSKTKGL